MLFGNDRSQLRQFYIDIWQKAQKKQTLDPLEQQIAQVIGEHPEYQSLLTKDEVVHTDFNPETGQSNPFLHMGMHLALREQINTDRPFGIKICYNSLCHAFGSSHEAEHRMMDCLAEALWTAQKNGIPPDEQSYLRCLQKISDIQ